MVKEHNLKANPLTLKNYLSSVQQNSSHSPRLSPAQYSTVQNRGLKHQSFQVQKIMTTMVLVFNHIKIVAEKGYHIDWTVLPVYISLVHLWLIIPVYSLRSLCYQATKVLD